MRNVWPVYRPSKNSPQTAWARHLDQVLRDRDWVGVLAVHDPTPGIGYLWLRLPLAVALLWWGARSDRRWVVPIAAMLGLPVLRITGLVLLVGCIPLARSTSRV